MLNDDVDIKISHLVMQRFKVTEKAILSVIEGGRLVNCTFLEDLISALEKSFCFSLHNYEK